MGRANRGSEELQWTFPHCAILIQLISLLGLIAALGGGCVSCKDISFQDIQKKLTHTLPYPCLAWPFPPGFQHNQGTGGTFLNLLLLYFLNNAPRSKREDLFVAFLPA